jgi:pimeloyl-ACP methyl ester carboxylesterase
MGNNNRVRAVISLHGIRTTGVWQKNLGPELALAGFIPYALDYGIFPLYKLMSAENLHEQVEWLLGEYDRIRVESGCARPSVVAHSFGTLQVARLLEKHSQVDFDKVIFAASIVPADFRWGELLDKQRVRWVLNDYGGKDLWPKLAQRLICEAGSSGTTGFAAKHPSLHQVRNPFHKHSDYFAYSSFRYRWLPTLLLDKRQIIDDLQYLMVELERGYRPRLGSIRCSVFAEQLPADRTLKAISGLHVGEFFPGEEDLVIDFNKLGPRSAPAVAFRTTRESRFSGHDIEALKEYDRTVHPGLKWLVALPVPLRADYKRSVGAILVEGFEDTYQYLPGTLLENPNVFEVLVRTGEALDALSFVR